MTETWFLDLDGVRSGPYQTSEVMSLIAEGEILPHHRIATHLKDAPWITILDWRLNQARPQTPAPQSVTPIQTTPPAPEPVTPPVPEVAYEIPEAQNLSTEPDTKEFSEESKSSAFDLEALVKAREEALGMITPDEGTPAKTETANPSSTSAPQKKRDPAAEMFEILQTSKQKREAKQNTTKTDSQKTNSGVSSSGAKTLHQKTAIKSVSIGLLIVLLGFLLGQLFQQSAPVSKEQSPSQAKATATPAPTVEPAKESKTEVIDRSTDKMTIRATVEKKVHHEETGGAETGDTPQRKMNDREIEEIRDLKRELQELKALKEEIRSNPNIDSVDPSASGMEPTDLDENGSSTLYPNSQINHAPNHQDPETLRN